MQNAEAQTDNIVAAHKSVPRRVSVPLVAGIFLIAGLPITAVPPLSADMLAAAVLGSALVALSIIDIETMRLPDLLTLPLIAAGIFSAPWLDRPLLESAAAACLASALLYAVAATYRRLRARDGLGMGDVKLFAASGAWVGIDGLAPVLLWSTMLALTCLLAARFVGRTLASTDEIPFGPFIALGTWIVWTHASIN